MHAAAYELHGDRRTVKQLRVVGVIRFTIELVDGLVRGVLDVAGRDMGDGKNDRRIVEEIPLGEITPPPGMVSQEEKARHCVYGGSTEYSR